MRARIGLAVLAIVLLALGAFFALRAPDGTKPPAAYERAGARGEQPEPTAAATARDRQTGQLHKNSDERLFGCSIEDLTPDLEPSAEEIFGERERRYEAVVDALTRSTDIEHRLAAALLKANNDRADAIDDLAALLPLIPEHPLLNWMLLDACALQSAHPLCASGEAESRVIDVLGANGEAWVKIAYYRVQRNDLEAGLEALFNASSAALFDDYWGASIGLTFHGLAAADNSPAGERLYEAVGYVSAYPMPHLQLVTTCKERAVESPDWLKACLAYGQRKEEQTRTVIGRGIGIGIQRAMHTAAGEPEKAAAARVRERSAFLQPLKKPFWADSLVVLAHDESLALDYLQQLTVYGEYAAFEFLETETIRRAQIPGYDPCPSSPPM